MHDQVPTQASPRKPDDPFAGMLADGFLLLREPPKPLDVGKRKRLWRRGLASPISEAKTHTRRGARKGDAGRELERAARELFEVLELGGSGGGSASFTRSSTKDLPWAYSARAGREVPITRGGLGWRSKGWRIRPGDVLGAAAGRDRVSVSGIERTALLTVDVDLHGARGSEKRAELAGPVVAALRAVLPGIEVHVETTPRGYHASVLLDRPVPAARAAELADRWARSALASVDLEPGVGVEAFPKLGHDGAGRGCALPIGRGQRLVGGDLLSATHRTRAADLRAILDGMRAEPSEVAAALLGLPSGELPAGRVALALAPATSGGQVFGEEFVVECLRLLEEGIDDDESWHAVRIMVGACKYAGLSDDEARLAMGAWLRRDGHRATHCQSGSGVRALENTVRAQLRWFRRGLLGGRCREGGMDAPVLRALLRELAGLEYMASEQRGSRWRPRRARVPAGLEGTELGRFMAA